MSRETTDLLGGKSVYCVSQGQIQTARRIAEEHPESAPRIQAEIERLEKRLARNERAALAMILIERLRCDDD